MKIIKHYIALLLLFIPFSAHAGFLDDLLFDIVKDAIVNSIAESLGESAGLRNIKEAADAQRKNSTKHLNSYNSKLYGLNEIGASYGDEILNDGFDHKSNNGYFVDSYLNDVLEKKISENIAVATRCAFPNNEKFTHKVLLNNFFSGKTYCKWTQVRGQCSDLDLMESMYSNPTLFSVFENDNDLLSVYAKNSRGKLKDDMNVLYYLKNMDRFSDVWDAMSKTLGLYNAQNVRLVDNAIYEGANSIGQVTCLNGYSIECTNSRLMDFYPMENAIYRKNEVIWKTDKVGRPIHAHTFVKKITKENIDQNKLNCVRFIKGNFNVWGHAKDTDEKKSDCVLLLIPSQFGGDCSFINQILVDKNVIKSSKNILKLVKKALKKNESLEYEVTLTYPDNLTFRPKEICFVLIENGQRKQIVSIKN